jgi:hypothetical protein
MCRILVPPVVVLLSMAAAWAQQPPLEINTPGDKPVPVVTFDMVFAGVVPAHYSIAVESLGTAAYRSDDVGGEPNESSGSGPYAEKITLSGATAKRIFDLARQANYFQGNFNYSKGKIANTGAKTLTYSDGPADSFGKPTVGIHNQTAYNYSENTAIQQLTEIFEDISGTIELGRKLRYLYRFDKLGLDAELKAAEGRAQDHQLMELQLIAPTLQDLADDSSLLHMVRQRAQNLIKMAGPGNQP